MNNYEAVIKAFEQKIKSVSETVDVFAYFLNDCAEIPDICKDCKLYHSLEKVGEGCGCKACTETITTWLLKENTGGFKIDFDFSYPAIVVKASKDDKS